MKESVPGSLLKCFRKTKTVHRDGHGVDVTVVSRGRQEGWGLKGQVMRPTCRDPLHLEPNAAA